MIKKSFLKLLCFWIDFLFFLMYFGEVHSARVAKLADAPDLGSGVLRRVGSNPTSRTTPQNQPFLVCFSQCPKTGGGPFGGLYCY